MDNFWLSKTSKLKEETRTYYRQLIHRLNIYLESHIHAPLGSQELGEYLHISHHHLSTIFAEMEQESLGAYIRRYRLEKSASLLQYTRLNLDEIAATTGYSGKHALSKAFGATFGRSPGAFRKKIPFFKYAANMVMDGIHYEEEYCRLLRKDVTCNWRIAELKGLSMISGMVNYFPASPALLGDYGAFIQSALEDTALIQNGDTIIKFFDAPNYTDIRRFKAEHGVLVQTASIRQPASPTGYFQVHPLREGRYLVFEIAPGLGQNEGDLITLVRDNLIGYNKAFPLTDFYAFYRLSGRKRTPGEYYIWLGELK